MWIREAKKVYRRLSALSGASLVHSMISSTVRSGGATRVLWSRCNRREQSSDLVDDHLAIGLVEPDASEPWADLISCLAGLAAFDFDFFAVPCRTANADGMETANEFVGGDLAASSEDAILGRCVERDEEMAQRRFALVEFSGDLANGDAGAMDGPNGGGGVKIVKAGPVGLEMRDRESVVHQ